MNLRDIPTHEQAKIVLSDALTHGDCASIAALCDCDASTLKRQKNPDDELKSWYGQFKRFLWATFHVNRQAFDRIWNDLAGDVERWRASSTNEAQCLSRLTGAVGAEYGDFIRVALENKPVRVQLKEARELRDAVVEIVRCLEEQARTEQPRADRLCPDGATEHNAIFS